MLNMRSFLFILALSITASLAAQNTVTPEGYKAKESLRNLADGTGSVQTFDNRYEGVRGTPFVFEAYMPGEVFFKEKSRVAIKELNYNCFENEIVYMDPATKVIRLVNRYQVDLFTITNGGEVLTFVPIQLEEDSETVFAQVLYNKGSMVYKVYGKEWLKANYEGGYSADRKYDAFVDKYDLYFLKQGDQTLYKVKRSKKQIIAAFPGREKDISAFIKSSKLDLKMDDSLVQLLEYYDSL
jgi:hypothetical protein